MTRKVSDQPAHTHSLNRAFASGLNILCVLSLCVEFLSLTGGCTRLSESTLVEMPHCWKSHAAAQLCDFGISWLYSLAFCEIAFNNFVMVI